MNPVTYRFKGETYTIDLPLIPGTIQDSQWYADQLNHAKSQGDYTTVSNRLNAGIVAGFVKKIS